MKSVLTALIAFCLCLTLTGDEKVKHYQLDIPSLKALAKKGDPDAQWHLGARYFSGGGVGADGVDRRVQRDVNEGIKWYRLAAHNGELLAQKHLSSLFMEGKYLGKKVVEANIEEALMWRRKAATQGDIFSQYALGHLYSNAGLNNKVVKKNDKEAAKWYLAAAKQGDTTSQTEIADKYREGIGVLENDKEALKWYRKAAEQGDPDGQYSLGDMYQHGEGVLEDYTVAYAWYNIAVANSPNSSFTLAIAKRRKDELVKKMTPELIAEGQKLSREMIKKNPKLIKE